VTNLVLQRLGLAGHLCGSSHSLYLRDQEVAGRRKEKGRFGRISFALSPTSCLLTPESVRRPERHAEQLQKLARFLVSLRRCHHHTFMPRALSTFM
jgi:hypothetical protein